jgi:hypothetical protein
MGKKRKNHKVEAAAATSEGRGYAYIEGQAWMLVPPWLAVIGLGILGGILHLVLAGDMLRLAWGVFALTLATVVLTVAAAVISRPRGQVTRVLAIASVVASGIWLVVTSIVGVTVIGVDLVALLIGAVLAVIANLRRLLRGKGEDAGHTQSQDWGDLAGEVKTLQTRVRAKRVEGATQRATLELPPGTTVQDIQGETPQLEQLLRIPPGGARISPDPDDAGLAHLHITPADMLRDTIRWPGPTGAGQSAAEPIGLGRYEDVKDLEIVLPGIPGKRPLSHILLVGMTGAGKSELIQVLVATLGCRTDVVVDYLDVAGKAEQTVGPIRAAIRTLVTEKREGERYLRQLLAEVPGRAQTLAAAGMREWQTGADLPLQVVIIDEGASLVSESDVFVELVRVLRSVGVVIVLALQRATYDQMPTSARANFGTSICFGVRASSDARGALSDDVREAGAAPERWKNKKPGYLYLEGPGIDEERCAMPARAYLADPKDVERILAEAAHLRYQESSSRASRPAVTPAAPPVAVSPEQTRALASAVVEEEEAAQEEEQLPSYQPPADMADEVAGVDPDADLVDIPGVDMASSLGAPDRVPPTTPEEAAAALSEFLAQFRTVSGMDRFQRRDLIAAGVLQACGRRKGWLSGELVRRVDSGELVRIGDREDGVYAWAELALVGAHAGDAS